MSRLCKCGCGEMPRSRGAQWMPGHHLRKDGDTYRSHRAVARRVLGRELPEGAEIHHVDGDKRNNEHSNLVICQDHAYHALLHYRLRVLRGGGNPNTDGICGRCGLVKPLGQFNRRGAVLHGVSSSCKACASEKWALRVKKYRRVWVRLPDGGYTSHTEPRQ